MRVPSVDPIPIGNFGAFGGHFGPFWGPVRRWDKKRNVLWDPKGIWSKFGVFWFLLGGFQSILGSVSRWDEGEFVVWNPKGIWGEFGGILVHLGVCERMG